MGSDTSNYLFGPLHRHPAVLSGVVVATVFIVPIVILLSIIERKNDQLLYEQEQRKSSEESYSDQLRILSAKNEELEQQNEQLSVRSQELEERSSDVTTPLIRQDSSGSNSSNTAVVADHVEMNYNAPSPPSYPEPTELEMKEAVLQKAVHKLGADLDDSVASIEVFGLEISRNSIEYLDFEKLGCKPALEGAGYTCSYKFTVRPYGAIIGAFGPVTGTATSRFAKTENGWIASQN